MQETPLANGRSGKIVLLMLWRDSPGSGTGLTGEASLKVKILVLSPRPSTWPCPACMPRSPAIGAAWASSFASSCGKSDVFRSSQIFRRGQVLQVSAPNITLDLLDVHMLSWLEDLFCCAASFCRQKAKETANARIKRCQKTRKGSRCQYSWNSSGIGVRFLCPHNQIASASLEGHNNLESWRFANCRNSPATLVNATLKLITSLLKNLSRQPR